MDIVERRTWFWYYRCLKDHHLPNFQGFYQAPDGFMQQALVVFKDDRASTVCRVHLGTHDYVVKRHNLRGWWHAMKKALIRSRALRSWDMYALLAAHHIPSVVPIAFMEQRWGPFQIRSYFVSQYLEGCDAFEIFQYAHPRTQEWGIAVPAIIRLIQQLDAAGLLHRDLNLSNIRIHQGRAFLLDFDGIQCVDPLIGLTHPSQNQVRFLRNWAAPNYASPAAYDLFARVFT